MIAHLVVIRTKGVYPSITRLFHTAPVHSKPESISRNKPYGVPVTSRNNRNVRKPVGSMHPPIETTKHIIYHAVGVQMLKFPQ